jgi:hypothetical protein
LRGDPGNAVVFDFVQLFMIPTVVGVLGVLSLSCTATFMVWHVRPELFTKRSVATRRQFAAVPATGAPANADQKDTKDASGQNESQDANSQNDSRDADGQNDCQDAASQNDCLDEVGQNDSQGANSQSESQDVDDHNDSPDADGQDDSEYASQVHQKVRRSSHWG